MVPPVFAVATAPDGRFDAIPMDEGNHPPSLEDLDARLRKARGKAHPANAAEGEGVPAGKKSLAFSVTYQSGDKTLTDKEVAKAQSGIIKRLKAELSAEVRG